jgi:uncharacterized protein (DUF433 family)
MIEATGGSPRATGGLAARAFWSNVERPLALASCQIGRARYCVPRPGRCKLPGSPWPPAVAPPSTAATPVQEYNADMSINVPPRSAADGRVISNPAVLGGRPVFAGTRVPVAALFEYLADGLSLDYFLESFPTVTREPAVAVLGYGLQGIERELT